MNQIRAFVGHSFTEDDAGVMDAFLKHFDTLQRSAISFSWVHAQLAEPAELAAKVMRLMSDCNVLIAICTRKQRSVLPTELQATYFPWGFLKAPEEKFLWKTSDWIIQEIGLALGKGLSLILLLETGVETPGGLQGNIEYIKFSRENPQASFDKILEMIIALSPNVASVTTQVADPRLSPAEQHPESEPPGIDKWWIPEPGWTEVQYDFALMHVIGTGEDEGRLKELNDAFAKSEIASQNDNKARWQAQTEYYRIAYGKNGSIENLKKLAEEFPKSSGVLEQLGRALAKFGEYREAGHTFKQAADLASLPEHKMRLLARAAQTYSDAKQSVETLGIIARIREQVLADPHAELRALRALVAVAKKNNDIETSIPLLERIVELRPDDRDVRFELAFSHSQSSSKALALLHYSKIPEHERDGATWNNLGVASNDLELPGEAVDAYRKAEIENETLAMSNIASAFLKAGFLAEAKAQCEKALKVEDPHRNVGLVWSAAKVLPDEERKRREEIFAKAVPISEFLRQFGRAAVRPIHETVAKEWIAPDALLTITFDGNSFTAEGAYERTNPFGGFFDIALGRAALDIKPVPEKWWVRYSGEISGRSVKGSVARGRVGEDKKPSSLLSTSTDESPEVMMVLTDDGAELKVKEQRKGNEARFYSIRRAATSQKS